DGRISIAKIAITIAVRVRDRSMHYKPPLLTAGTFFSSCRAARHVSGWESFTWSGCVRAIRRFAVPVVNDLQFQVALVAVVADPNGLERLQVFGEAASELAVDVRIRLRAIRVVFRHFDSPRTRINCAADMDVVIARLIMMLPAEVDAAFLVDDFGQRQS